VVSSILETATTESLVLLASPSTPACYSNGIYNDSFTFNTGDGNDTIEGQGHNGISNQGLINTGNGKDIIIANGGKKMGRAIVSKTLSPLTLGRMTT
jgi:hypothetical protein